MTVYAYYYINYIGWSSKEQAEVLLYRRGLVLRYLKVGWPDIFWKNRGQFLKTEYKLKLSEDRGQISKIEDSPLKNQADGQPT